MNNDTITMSRKHHKALIKALVRAEVLCIRLDVNANNIDKSIRRNILEGVAQFREALDATREP